VPIYALGDRVPQIHHDAYVHPDAVPRRHRVPDAVVIGDVRVGADSSIWPTAVLRGDYGTIIVGERTSIQDGTVVHAVDRYPTVIGDDCVIGHLAHLEGCTIHDRALVGSGSIVLHEAVVRNRMEVPANAMALGVPAVLKLDSCNDAVALASAALYASNGRRYREELRKL
jgi:carbonic anhydrase/acetyltransferase-like protein (isoleucine patch superfamily)